MQRAEPFGYPVAGYGAPFQGVIPRRAKQPDYRKVIGLFCFGGVAREAHCKWMTCPAGRYCAC
ncbi:hypothetical protein AERO8C_30069 [Aeromonas veronii]|uniref:Uncharacterized protein n=1 Tax=Aeromonas veronii TaxID=654 RepID=A0A653L530_AERVE|nr:hypothetical protein AERO8C_30069 [Aeromonas veronii]